ncbi:MAG: SGNH/GDSL hydrolase family protein [Planctomycetes bacterium]|nr:SGNH/GDSL hydrolase family protein [Planctomycetota bacterium]
MIRSKIVRRLGLLVMSATLALVVAEIALRIVDPFHTGEVLAREAFEHAILESHWEFAGPVLRPNVSAEFLGHEHRTNSARMRNPEIPVEKPSGVFRVAVAGDSIAFGWGVEESDCFPRVLERMLNDGPKPPGIARFEVINGGTPGWGIPGYAYWLKNTGLAYDPDAVVVTFINNDLTELIKTVEGDAAAPDVLVLPGWCKWSYVARAWQNVDALWFGARGDLALALKSNPQVTDPACDLACQGLEVTRQFCGERPFVVVDTLGDEHGSWLPRFVQDLADRRIARIDAFLPLADYQNRFAVSAIDVHPNAAGHRLYAEWIHAWLRAHAIPR